jgi:outer membrane protein OmpA-like peptidoglycan-associated protein
VYLSIVSYSSSTIGEKQMKKSKLTLTAIPLAAIALTFVANANAIDFGKIAGEAAKKTRQVSADLEQIAKKLEKLRSDKVKVEEDERGIVLTFSAQLFAVGKADLTDEAKGYLKEAAATLLEYPNADVEIEGHTDSTGSAKLNQELSEKRAKNVMNFLIEQGVQKERLSAVGYGKDRPIADNKTEEGRATNRRVELVVKEKEPEPEVKEEKVKDKEGVRFGIRTGIGATGLNAYWEKKRMFPGRWEVADSLESLLGFDVGIGGFALIPISFLYFAPELSIHYRKPSTNGFIEESEIGIDIPLMFRFPLGEERKFHIEIGPQIDFIIGAFAPAHYDNTVEYGYGLSFGGGYLITDNWDVDLRIFYSITSHKRQVYYSEGMFDYGEYQITAPLYYVQIGVSYIF